MRTRKITFGLILGAAITLSSASVQAGNSSFSISFSSGGGRCAPRSSVYYSSGGGHYGNSRHGSRHHRSGHYNNSSRWSYSYESSKRHCPPPRYAPPPRRCDPRPQHHCNAGCGKHGSYRNSGQSTVVIVNNNNYRNSSRYNSPRHGWQHSRNRYSNQMHNSPRHGWQDSRSRYSARRR